MKSKVLQKLSIQIMEKLKSLFTEWNDSPADFIRHLLIVFVIVTVWGLVMGMVGE